MDELGQLAYSVWYYPSLAHDEDQRDNEIGARRQRVQILMARWQQATSWFNPELLALPLERVREWMAGSAELAVYRFAIENLYRLQEHVLDDKGEQLMSLVGRFDSAPSDAYEALSTADAKFPAITLERRAHGDGVVRGVPVHPRHGPAAGRPRGGLQGVPRDRSRPRATRMRRCTTACASATGSWRRRAATARRWTPRCTATTFRRRWSRT